LALRGDGWNVAIRETQNGTRRAARGGQREGADPHARTWESMLAHLRAHYPQMCRQWFEEITPLGIADGALEMRTATVLHRDYLQRTCADAFNDAARTVSGYLLSVRFLGPGDASSAAPAAPPVPAAAASGAVIEPKAAAQPWPLEPAVPPEPPVAPAPRPPAIVIHDAGARTEALVVNPDYSFENFVVGPNNRLAHAAAVAVASNPGRAYNPLFIHGGVGLGKTHLLQAICLKIVEANPRAVLYYTSCEGFVTQFFDSVQSGEMAQFRHRFRDVDVLIIDDIHFLTKRDRSQEEFFHTFNSLFHANKQIILSSDAPPEEIPDLEERLVSRFKWGLVCKIDAPDYETRIQILKTKARLRGMHLPDDAAQFIAQRVDSNIRELEGVVAKLLIQSHVDRRPVDLEMAQASVGDRPPRRENEPTIQSIIGVVTEFYGIRLSDLQSKLRQRSIALPRHVCMFLARRATRLSLEEIGGFFGGRDHTTVMHAVKAVEEKMGADPEFVSILKMLEERARAARSE